MPKLMTDPPLDAIRALHDQGATIRVIAKRLGISHSFAHRYVSRIYGVVVVPERIAAGRDPLPAGHPLSWCAISALPFDPRLAAQSSALQGIKL